MLGALLALASAATFGFNNAAIRRGVLTGSVVQAMMITVPMGVPLFALACLPFGGIESLLRYSTASWLWMTLAGVIHFVIGRYSNYRSTHALGANLSSPLQQLSVPISIVLAMIYLDETLSPLSFTGFILVMLGPALTVRRNKGDAPKKTKSGFEPRYGEGILWGIISALAYGASPLFIMKGLGPDGGLVDSIAGGLISYTSATVAILILVLFTGGFGFMQNLDQEARKWFLLSGVLVFFSQLFRYMSLAVAPVAVAVSIQRLSPVFRLIFSWILNRDHEFFDFQVIMGIGVSLFGALLMTLNIDMVAALLPTSWEPFMRIEWP
jgi:drug/metabolite transporter (DMT)-like permease